MSDRPPVTQQDAWESTLLPWIRAVEEALETAPAPLDVDRVHVMTGVVAQGVQRSMAPISAYLVGVAVGKGADLQQACRIVEEVTRRRS